MKSIKKHKLLYYFFYLIIVSCGKENDIIESTNNIPNLSIPNTELVDALNNEIDPIGNIPLNISNEELQPLDKLSDVSIIGLGEATHGTKQFFQMKHRIFQYLVENHGFKYFIFEMGIAEALVFNDWIHGRTNDDLKELMLNRILYSVWRTEEVRELLEWMRNYNMGKLDGEKIGFYGVDAQSTKYNLDMLVDRVRDFDFSMSLSIKDLNRDYKTIYLGIPNENKSKIIEGITSTQALIQSRKEEIIAWKSLEEFLWLEQLIRNMKQTVDVVTRNNFSLRDQYMAENTAWYFKLLGEQSKFVLWAHNSHVQKGPNPHQGLTQGSFLEEEFNDKYKTIGFSFSIGTFSTWTVSDYQHRIVQLFGPLPKESYNRVFNRLKTSNFILDIEKVENETVKTWLSKKLTLTTAGWVFSEDVSNYYRTTNILSRDFDYIINFDYSNESSVLQR